MHVSYFFWKLVHVLHTSAWVMSLQVRDHYTIMWFNTGSNISVYCLTIQGNTLSTLWELWKTTFHINGMRHVRKVTRKPFKYNGVHGVICPSLLRSHSDMVLTLCNLCSVRFINSIPIILVDMRYDDIRASYYITIKTFLRYDILKHTVLIMEI